MEDALTQAPLYTFSVIVNPKKLHLSDPSTKMLIFQDRLIIGKGRTILFTDIRSIIFEGGTVALKLSQETILLGSASTLATGTVDPAESASLASLLEGLRVVDDRLIASGLLDLKSLARMRTIEKWRTALLVVIGIVVAYLFSGGQESLHWFGVFILALLLLIVLGVRGSRHEQEHQAVESLLRGQASQAVDALMPLRKNHPNWVELHLNLGIALLHVDRYPEARECFKHVLQLNPDHPQQQVIEEMIRRCDRLKQAPPGKRPPARSLSE